MTSQYRHRRAGVSSIPFTNPLEPGEIAVNTANRQIAVGDAASGTVGTPVPLLALRYFDARAQYVVGDFVIQGAGPAAVIYRANTTISPGAFNVAQWDFITGGINPAYVLKSGSTMTGPLVLPGDPVNPLEAADKNYVDVLIAAKSSVIVSDTPPVGVIDNTLWFESDTGFTYLMFNDGTSRQWVLQAGPPPDASQFVQRTGDTMSGKLIAPALQAATLATASYSTPLSIDASVLNLQSLSGGIVTAPTMPAGNNTSAVANTTFVQNAITTYAAPMDAMAYSGMQINGSFNVAQEKGVGGAFGGTGYVGDVWYIFGATTGAGIAATSVQSGTSVAGFSQFMNTFTSTPQTTLNAIDLYFITEAIEGYRISRLAWGTPNAQPITIGFWTWHSLTGLYSVSVRNGASNRSYVTSYTQNVANVAQYNVVTIPGDVAGTWSADNTVGMSIGFAFAAGSTYVAPSANSWQAGNFVAVPGQVQGYSSTSNNFRITGVVILPGTAAPSAARSPLIMRPYDQELVTCQRYFNRFGGNGIAYEMFGSGIVINPTTAYANMFYPRMRSAPTASATAGSTFAVTVAVGTIPCTIITAPFISPTVTLLQVGVASGLVAGQGALVGQNASVVASINLDARL